MSTGDTLKLSVTGHKLYSDSDDFVHFNGFTLDQSNCVAFNAVKRRGGNFNGLITFDSADVNLGESFNPSSGEFVAPHTGNYYFSLSGVTGTNKGVTTISVSRNGEVFYVND